ncbi:MAG: DMT family transporter [Promethearchaeota archaeon]
MLRLEKRILEINDWFKEKQNIKNIFITINVLQLILDNKNLKKGLLFGILGVFSIGFQPIVANMRPLELDAYIFAAMTVIFEAVIFFPLMLMERRNIKSNFKKNLITEEDYNSLLNGYKKHVPLLIFIGLAFGIGMILYFIGYRLAGTINGSLAQKSTVFFALVFGVLIMNEKIKKTQIIFSLILFFGLILAVTQGSFNLLTLNIGVTVILLLSFMWMFTHAITKKYILDNKEGTPSEMVFSRNLISGIILFSTYFFFYPLENVKFFYDPMNWFWFISMGAVYGFGLYCWYQCLLNLDTSKASILMAPTPIATAVFAVIFIGEPFTLFHIFGTLLIIISIYMIVSSKKEVNNKHNGEKN